MNSNLNFLQFSGEAKGYFNNINSGKRLFSDRYFLTYNRNVWTTKKLTCFQYLLRKLFGFYRETHRSNIKDFYLRDFALLADDQTEKYKLLANILHRAFGKKNSELSAQPPLDVSESPPCETQSETPIIPAKPLTLQFQASNTPKDMLREIASHLSPKDIKAMRVVNKHWHQAVTLIDYINKKKLPLREVFPYLSSSEVIAYLMNDPSIENLKHLDLNGMEDFTNEDLEKLLTRCPNLKYLSLVKGKLKPGALKYLKHTPDLQYLYINCRIQFEADGLKNLKYTHGLQHLNIIGCTQFEADGLKHLEHTPGLQYLDINWCTQFEADGLKNLKYTRGLQHLSINECNQFEADGLKHLEHTPGLRSLRARGCKQLKLDALIKPIPKVSFG